MESTVLTERRDGGILLIGINRPQANNRIDPPTYIALGQALYNLEHDGQLRVGVLYATGPDSSRRWTSQPTRRLRRRAPFPRPRRGPTSWTHWT